MAWVSDGPPQAPVIVANSMSDAAVVVSTNTWVVPMKAGEASGGADNAVHGYGS